MLLRRPGIAELTRRARSPIALQVSTFTGASALASIVGGIWTMLLARSLSTSAYGSYSFAVSALALGAMFFEFGLFLPPARQLARGEVPRGEAVAATTVAFLPVGGAFVACVFVLSFSIDKWFRMDVGEALRAVAPLLIAYPYEFVAFQLAQGLDRVGLFSVARVLGRSAAVVSLLSLLLMGRHMTVATALVLESAALLLAWSAFTVGLRPQFSNVATRLSGFIRGSRQYGFQVYIGRVLSIGTYNVDTLMVAAFTEARSVAFYALASRISDVIGLPGSGLAASLFSRMAREDHLRRTWLAAAWSLGLIAAALACLLVGPFLRLVIGVDYLQAASLLPPLALAQVIRSVTSLYNAYLAAHARGVELRNAAITLTVANVVLNLALIPAFGAVGAAWASLCALLVNLGAHIAYYRRAEQQALVA